jgi:hypothetical protein
MVRQNIMAPGGEEAAIHHMADRKHTARNGPDPGETFKGRPHSDPLLPARPYLLKFLKPPKIAVPSGKHVFNS